MRDPGILIVEMATMADEILKAGFRSAFTSSRKSGGDIVTSVDLEVDRSVSDLLTQSGYPSEMIVSEEGAASSCLSESFWLIDPLDGTREFAAGVPEFSFSAAWAVRGRVEAAVVSNPVVGVRVSGVRGRPLSVEAGPSAQSFLESVREACLVSHTEFRAGLFAKLAPPPQIQAVGSIAFKLALVAAGLAPATTSLRPKSSWDIAAGVGLVEMAGGRAKEFSGKEFSFADGRKRYCGGVFASLGKGPEGHFSRLGEIFRGLPEPRGGDR